MFVIFSHNLVRRQGAHAGAPEYEKFAPDLSTTTLASLGAIGEGGSGATHLDIPLRYTNSAPIASVRSISMITDDGICTGLKVKIAVSDHDIPFGDAVNISPHIKVARISYKENASGASFTKNINAIIPSQFISYARNTKDTTDILIAPSGITKLLCDTLGLINSGTIAVKDVTFAESYIDFTDRCNSSVRRTVFMDKITSPILAYGHMVFMSIAPDKSELVGQHVTELPSIITSAMHPVITRCPECEANGKQYSLECVVTPDSEFRDKIIVHDTNCSVTYPSASKPLLSLTQPALASSPVHACQLSIEASDSDSGIGDGDIVLTYIVKEFCGASATAKQTIHFLKHKVVNIALTDKEFSGRVGDELNVEMPCIISNLCSLFTGCTNDQNITVNATTNMGGISAAYDALKHAIIVSGTIPDTTPTGTSNINVTVAAGQANHPTVKKVGKVILGLGEKLTHTQELSVADVSNSIAIKCGESGSIPSGEMIASNPCVLCTSEGKTFTWTCDATNFQLIPNGDHCAVRYAGNLSTLSAGIHPMPTKITCKHGDEEASETYTLTVTVTMPDLPPIAVGPDPTATGAKGAKVVILGPTVTTSTIDRSPVSSPEIYGTFVTGTNSPTFQVNESNVDFEDATVNLHGAIRTGGTDTAVGKPLKFWFDPSLTIPIGGDVGVIEPAR